MLPVIFLLAGRFLDSMGTCQKLAVRNVQSKLCLMVTKSILGGLLNALRDPNMTIGNKHLLPCIKIMQLLVIESKVHCIYGTSIFDSVRFHIVDPMHNLYLGTSKYVMKQILNTTSSSGLIQERVDKCIVPSSLGRIPHKISSAYASLTFLNFVQLSNHYMGLRMSHQICTCTLTLLNASRTMDQSIHSGCSHLNDTMVCWVTNQRSIELQLMRRFMSDLQLHDTTIPEDYISNGDLDFLVANENAGTLRDTSSFRSDQYLEIVQASCCPLANFPPNLDIYSPGGVMSTEFMEGVELRYLQYVTVLRKRYILRAKMKIELLIPRCSKFPGL